MEFHLHVAISVLCLSLISIHAALPSEQYWNSVLPATPMPRAITDALRPGQKNYDSENYSNDGKRKSNNRHYGGNRNYGATGEVEQQVLVNPTTTPKNRHYGNNRNYGAAGEVNQQVLVNPTTTPKNRHYGNNRNYGATDEVDQQVLVNPTTTPKNRHYGGNRNYGATGEIDQQVLVNPTTTPKNRHYGGNRNYGATGEIDQQVLVNPTTTPKNRHYGGNRNYGATGEVDQQVLVTPTTLPKNRNYGEHNRHYGGNRHYDATGEVDQQVLVNPPTAFYFLEKDLYTGKGKEMKLEINRGENGVASAFIPRNVANSIPFSSTKLSAIFHQLSVKPGSNEANNIKETIKECEEPANKGEERQCVTSLESMIDFSVAALGKNITAVSTVAEKDTMLQEFRMLHGVERLAGDKAVVCHKEDYPYAVFYCHALNGTKSYLVPLVGADGTKAKATAVCHMDTSGWNPNHMAFKILNVKAGTVPVCHFLPEYDVVWTRK